jgi:hypothetical protein
MSAAFRRGIADTFPGAEIIYDKFHQFSAGSGEGQSTNAGTNDRSGAREGVQSAKLAGTTKPLVARQASSFESGSPSLLPASMPP